MKKFLPLTLVLSLFTSFSLKAQCNAVETITICDMTVIDNDSDGQPDGIINLYDAYNAQPTVTTPISSASGTWFDPNFNFALNEATGDLFLWDLPNASRNVEDYQFQLIDANSSCPDGIVARINVVLGPFSGFARPVLNVDDENLEVCDMGSTPGDICIQLPDVDLFEALESIPSPHLNGIWIYKGNSPNFISLSGSEFTVTIPYSEGPPLVDQETFELTYRVNGISSCNTSMETTVNISVTRQVFSGYAENKRICELDIMNGNYSADIDLRDDDYLLLEDVEGVWISGDAYGQILSPVDSSINIEDIYQQIIVNNGPRFGCEEVGFTYKVDQRSGVCMDARSTVRFKIYEYLRPFTQNTDLEFCEEDLVNPTTANLYDLIEFTNENGISFEYFDNVHTNWSFVSGPSDLRIRSASDINYTALGTVNLQNAAPGQYVFRYTVYPGINCPSDNFEVLDYGNICQPALDNTGLCNEESTQVVLTVHPNLYAGEHTIGLQFCETDPRIASPLDLFSLMTTNMIDDPIYQGPLGTWRDISGNVISNPFTIPAINGQQNFNFTYTTRTPEGCVDSANLAFTVFEAYQPGVNQTINVCSADVPFNLFDQLGGTPSNTGTWTGPNGYSTTDYIAMFDPATSEAGIYTYTVPNNLDANGAVICNGGQATVTVALRQSPNAGNNGSFSVCKSEQQIDLSNYLSPSADNGGIFTDLSTTNALTGNILDVSQLNAGRYNFQYEVTGHTSCAVSRAIITISIQTIAPPTANNQKFCASDAPTISDLVANNGLDFNWYATEDATTPLSGSTLLINGEDYFVAAVDANNCESTRVAILVELLPLGHVECDCLKDGVSVNNDGLNDDFDLCNLPEAFPNFEINIFNRYGTVVYKGNKNTPLFNGTSNVALTVGKKLATGVYFYVFDPKDGITAPFQGNLYLSR